jgi:hypothetical protein
MPDLVLQGIRVELAPDQGALELGQAPLAVTLEDGQGGTLALSAEPELQVVLGTSQGTLTLGDDELPEPLRVILTPALVGADGLSAYAVAVANGYGDSEAAWLASLHGAPGTNGTNGTDGADGASAYERAVANGFGGTEPEWLASLQGAPGADGADGVDGESPTAANIAAALGYTPASTTSVAAAQAAADAAQATADAALAGAGGIAFNVAQTAHGFSVGKVVYRNGASYALADRGASTSTADGVVSAVVDANNFTLTVAGKMPASGLTQGDAYFLSSAGAMTATEPTSGITQYLGYAESATVFVVQIGEPFDLTGTSGAGAIARSIVSISATTTAGAAAATDYVYLVTGTVTLNMPTAVGNSNRYTVKNVGSGTVTVDGFGSETMDGSATVALSPNQSLDFISDGTNWRII